MNQGVLDQAPLAGLVPPSRTIDEEIIDLKSAFPEAVEHLPAVFEESVVSSCKHLLGQKSSKTVLAALEGTDLGNPYEVYSAIDRVLPKGGSLVKSEIAAEFHAKVRSLFRLAISNGIDSGELARMHASLSSRLGV